MKKCFLYAFFIGLLFIASVNIAQAQCGLPGTPPCPKSTSKKPVKTNTSSTSGGTVKNTRPAAKTITKAPTITKSSGKTSVDFEAKILTPEGKVWSASKVKFHLLDKDLDSILVEAGIEDELGQGLVTAYALSVVEPDKYPEINRKSFEAIKPHILYSITTDNSGKAQLQDVKPRSYYFFAITTTKTGFVIWNAPVFINVGQNYLDFPPMSWTKVVD